MNNFDKQEQFLLSEEGSNARKALANLAGSITREGGYYPCVTMRVFSDGSGDFIFNDNEALFELPAMEGLKDG